jgi:hypothetical protein
VSTPRSDWDRNERDALAGLEDQVEAMRRRHRADPPFELIRAAHADVLPTELQAAVSEHLAESAMSRTLAEGLGPDEPALAAEDGERLLARVLKEAGRANTPARGWGWLRPLFLGSAVAAAALLVWFVSSRSEVAPTAPPESTVAIAQPPSVPVFLLPLQKPDVRVGMAALTWRGSTGTNNQLLADLKPGLDAYRQGDYATADRELTALAARYPGTIEILFYQGVSRLFLNDLTGAIAALTAAEAIGDAMFAADVSWYRAVAEQRAGNVVDARARLGALCRANSEGAARACAALDELAKAPVTPR